ncbi:SU10 major capsid protein [Bacillus sp. JJ722]|uniref:SU10 major capsid protein n=1 Tax=Bacillus sp. JJ722 TaxID=3122973 RepID=UPI003000851B
MSMIYNQDLIGKKQSVTDEILLLNADQTPMLNLLGFSEPATATTHVWYEDEMFATKSAVTVAAAVDAVELTVASVEPFRPDSVVSVGDEMLIVTAVNASSSKITVTRGHGETTPAAITKDTEIEFMYIRGEEGAAAREARHKQRKRVDNYTQIFDDSVMLTDTAQTVAQYGISDLYNYEKAKKELELALQLEKAIINGRKFDDGNVRQMRGIRSFIETNVTAATGAVTIDMLNDISQKIYEAGGFATGGQYSFIVPAKQKRKISDLSNDKLRVVQSEDSRGQSVDYLVNDFGKFPITMNNNLQSDELLFVDTNRIKIRPLGDRGFHHKLLGVDGDRTKGMLVGEYTLEFQQEKAHARIKGLA